MVISGCSAGLVAISNTSTGVVVRVISDHEGAPITDLHTARRPAKVGKERGWISRGRIIVYEPSNEMKGAGVSCGNTNNKVHMWSLALSA